MSIQNKIEEKLKQAMELSYLSVENESHMHNVPPGSESHFKVVLVSEEFEGKLPVKRHQSVYRVLCDEMQGAVHALALHTYTPSEWQSRQGVAVASPDCQGGGH
ncbi:BolA family protein [Endozoicomonadaceae bacterium StTr2]